MGDACSQDSNSLFSQSVEEDKTKDDERFMRMALDQAHLAYEKGEVPVGVVITCKGQVIARAHNLTEQLTDFTAHAEMQAFTMATEFLGNKYLDKCTLYVTLEPCVMCAGASFWTRIGRVVYGATDSKRGYAQLSENVLHPKTEIRAGVLADECGEIVSRFFQEKRSK